MDKKIRRKELLHIVTKLHNLFACHACLTVHDLDFTKDIARTYFRWVTCEGHHGLKRAKLFSNCLIRNLMGCPLEVIPLSNRYKRYLNYMINNADTHSKRVYWISVVCMFRLFRLKPIYDVSTITSRFKGRLYDIMTLNHLRSLRVVRLSFSHSLPSKEWSAEWKWHITGASGPNGPLAYQQYLSDLRILSKSLLGVALIMLYLSLPYVKRGDTIRALKDALVDSYSKGKSDAIHSRLVFLSDKGGKTRVIAIGDILSQTLLKTVHQRCNFVLRRLEQDGTFDQDRTCLLIRKMSEEKLPLASIDLTAATDRMPALFQMWVLYYLRILTPLQALMWWSVTTRRDFLLPGEGSPKYVRYKVGQPMGLLSSWPVMAVSHHFLVRWSFAVSGLSSLEKLRYCVLGDDLTLHGFNVAESYLKIIHALGMDFSKDKTYISIGVAEFAKRLFREGKDLSPFPLALLRFNNNTLISNVLAIISVCKERRIPLHSSTLLALQPRRWRNTVTLAALSPSSQNSALDCQSRVDFWLFFQFKLKQRIKYFSRLNTVRNSTHAFALKDPGSSGKTLASPFLQIARDNGLSYPVRALGDKRRNLSPEILLGLGWFSFCTKSWPDGIPTIESKTLLPGPTWGDQKIEKVIRSDLLKFNEILPGYFRKRCVGTEVGDWKPLDRGSNR